MIYFTIYQHDKILILNLHFDELILIKRIGIINFEDNKIMINADDKFSDDITLKNTVVLMKCVIKDSGICTHWHILEHKNLCMRT